MTLLGERKLRQWATVAALSCLGDEQQHEVVHQAVTRARFEELLAPLAGLAARGEEMFLMGLFSLIDVLMGRPIDEILPQLSLAEDVVAGLLGEDNHVARVHRLAVAFETGEWSRVSELAGELGVDESEIPSLLVDAVETARRLCSAAA
jgi:EAL and modified HD-GYP domain-containing signal transduction protein